MKKKIFRFVAPDNIELYVVKRGKLCFKDRIDSTDCVKYDIDQILLTTSHYVSETMLDKDINFVPENGQFLFSDQSILRIEDLTCIPAIFDESRKVWKQVWASKQLLLDIQKLIPSAKYFYPECLAVSPYELGIDNFSDAKFLKKAPSFPLAGAKRNTLFLIVLILSIFLVIAPWISHWFFYEPVGKTPYDNELLLIQHFEKFAVTSELSGLEKLTFNNSLNTINMVTQEIFSVDQKNTAERFCNEFFCEIDFKDYELTFIFSKRLSDD